MKLTINAVKRFPGMENQGWSCNLLLDGKKVGTATEPGTGGNLILVIPSFEHNKLIHEICLERYKAEGTYMELLETLEPFDGHASEFLVETAVAAMLHQADIDRQMKGWCRDKIMFQLPGDNPEQWRSIKKKYVPETDRVQIQTRYGASVIILNDRFL